MKKYLLFIVLLFGLGAIIYFKMEKNKTDIADMNRVLKENGLAENYVWDDSGFLKQSGKPSMDIVAAFTESIPALFTHSEKCEGCDDFYSLVKDAPEQFNLSGEVSAARIKSALQEALGKDKDFKVYLLPADSVTERSDGVKLFPPENGESIKDYWIWYIKTGFFPGPAWLLIKRDHSEKPYHYGII